jgi:hypothetical protein
MSDTTPIQSPLRVDTNVLYYGDNNPGLLCNGGQR